MHLFRWDSILLLGGNLMAGSLLWISGPVFLCKKQSNQLMQLFLPGRDSKFSVHINYGEYHENHSGDKNHPYF